jgi:hypothetical protein
VQVKPGNKEIIVEREKAEMDSTMEMSLAILMVREVGLLVAAAEIEMRGMVIREVIQELVEADEGLEKLCPLIQELTEPVAEAVAKVSFIKGGDGGSGIILIRYSVS